ncbi:hypothetical protein JYK21_02895 [Ralstonia pickettii]|nr:hypothetical protein [Ralstonia pickettii]
MNIIIKIIAAFLAPFTLTLLFLLYNITVRMMNGYSLNFTFDGIGFFIIYMYALPVYLFIGIPISLIIERFHKGIKWINYSLGGIAGGLFLLFINRNSNLQDLEDTLFLWLAAGLSYYASFALLEKPVQKLRNKKE